MQELPPSLSKPRHSVEMSWPWTQSGQVEQKACSRTSTSTPLFLHTSGTVADAGRADYHKQARGEHHLQTATVCDLRLDSVTTNEN